MEKIRLGVVGTGLIWEFTHMPVIDSLPQTFKVVALCARGKEKAEKWQRKYPNASIYGQYEDLIADSAVDAVVVATPISLNPIVTVAALRAGKHVFEEKPMATTGPEAEEVVRAEKESGKTVFLLEQNLYDPKIQKALSILKDKTLGDPVIFEMLTHFILDPQNDTTVGFGQTPWRIHPDFPLGAIFDGGAHDFAVITALFGLPRTLYSTGTKLRDEMGEYDHILTTFSFGGGLSGFHSHSAYLGCSNNYFNIRFTDGALYVGGNELIAEHRGGGKEVVPTETVQLHQVMWEQLANAYYNHSVQLFNSETAAQSVKIFDAIVESLRTDTSVRLS